MPIKNQIDDYESYFSGYTFYLQKWSDTTFEVVLSEYNDGNSYSASEKLTREDLIELKRWIDKALE